MRAGWIFGGSRSMAAIILGAACAWQASSASAKLLGMIAFPNSGAPEAQADFIEGVLYLHNFEYDEANEAFVRAREIDPDFAMAHWGEAMTYHHTLWNRQSRKEGQDALRRLGRTPEERAAKARTQREKDYLRAAETLFGMTEESRTLPKADRDMLYRDAMRRIHETYPDDHEATVFYGLSILGVGSENRDYATYMKAAAVLTEVWDANREHPGAAHYLIHSYDDPVHAPLGLPMARAYSEIAPAAAHAQHMTSHIFVALGMWDELVDANERAVEIEFETTGDESGRELTASHYVYWLQYGYLQQGRFGAARDLLDVARARLDEQSSSRERTYYGTMLARYLLDTGDWESADALSAPLGLSVPTPNYHYALAVADVERGRLNSARGRRESIGTTVEGSPEAVASERAITILQKQLDAQLAAAEGDIDIAIGFAEEAVALELKTEITYGPPHVVKPSNELLGEMLLTAGFAEEAVTAFQRQLEATPRRTASLLGLARAYEKTGESVRASHVYAELARVWHSAETGISGYWEVLESTS